MVYVIAACADQSKLINSNLPTTYHHNSYHLFDVLPGGEKDLMNTKMAQGLGKGSKIQLEHLIMQPTVLDTIEKVVWNGDPTVFGSVVSFFAILSHPNVQHQHLFNH